MAKKKTERSSVKIFKLESPAKKIPKKAVVAKPSPKKAGGIRHIIVRDVSSGEFTKTNPPHARYSDRRDLRSKVIKKVAAKKGKGTGSGGAGEAMQ